MKKLCFALLVAIALPTIGLAQAAPAATPNVSKYFPVSDVKPGMKGYGMTCFEGSTPERFEVGRRGRQQVHADAAEPMGQRRRDIVRLAATKAWRKKSLDRF